MHQCPASDCPIRLPDHLLMCKPHWYQVPKDLRSEVWRAYAGGAGIGSDDLLHAQMAAVDAVNERIETS